MTFKENIGDIVADTYAAGKAAFTNRSMKPLRSLAAAAVVAGASAGGNAYADSVTSTVDPNMTYSAELVNIETVGDLNRFTYELDNLSDILGGDGYDLIGFLMPAEGVVDGSFGTSSLPGFTFELYFNLDTNNDGISETEGIYGRALFDAFNVPASREPSTFSFLSDADALGLGHIIMQSYSGANLEIPIQVPIYSVVEQGTPVPEPATIALVGTGMGMIALYRRKKED